MTKHTAAFIGGPADGTVEEREGRPSRVIELRTPPTWIHDPEAGASEAAGVTARYFRDEQADAPGRIAYVWRPPDPEDAGESGA